MLNKVLLIGNLGNDPEVRYTQDGTAVCNMRLATSERFKNRNGELQERTEWHNLVFWGRLAEIVRDHLHKGDRIFVEGKLQTREWTDRDGNTRRTTEIRVSEMRILSGRRSGGEAPPRQGGAGGYAGGGYGEPPHEPVHGDDPFASPPGREDEPPEDVPF